MASAIDHSKGPQSLPDTWEVIERIQATLQIPDCDLAELLWFRPRDLEKHRKLRKPISLVKVSNLGEHLNLGIEPITTGEIDYAALTAHYFGERDYLPERYSGGGLSSRRSTLQMLDYVESTLGWRERLNILRRFQLNESIFANPDKPISYRCGTDIAEYLSRYKLSRAGMYQIGTETIKRIWAPMLLPQIKKCNSVEDLYSRMLEVFTPKSDRNLVYRIESIRNHRIVTSALPAPELIDAMKGEPIGTSATSILRAGVAAAFPHLLGLPAAKATITSCLYQGDSEFRMEIDFSEASAALRPHLQC